MKIARYRALGLIAVTLMFALAMAWHAPDGAAEGGLKLVRGVSGIFPFPVKCSLKTR